MEERFDTAARLCGKFSEALLALPRNVRSCAQEIRFRTQRPIQICMPGSSQFTENPVSREDISELFRSLCAFSVYTYQNEIKNGYVTLQGGHRVGICGTAVYENGEITGVRDVSSLDLRIARELFGAADSLLPTDISGGLLIAGAPCSGKTTLLRDLARQLAGGARGRFYKVAVVDERGELAGAWRGEMQNDLGICCDVLDGYPKKEGILLALRSLSPDVILCDELGDESDTEAVKKGICAGVPLIASVHIGAKEDLMRRAQTRTLLLTGAFSTAVVLRGRDDPGKTEGIYKVGDLIETCGDSPFGGGMYSGGMVQGKTACGTCFGTRKAAPSDFVF